MLSGIPTGSNGASRHFAMIYSAAVPGDEEEVKDVGAGLSANKQGITDVPGCCRVVVCLWRCQPSDLEHSFQLIGHQPDLPGSIHQRYDFILLIFQLQR